MSTFDRLEKISLVLYKRIGLKIVDIVIKLIKQGMIVVIQIQYAYNIKVQHNKVLILDRAEDMLNRN